MVTDKVSVLVYSLLLIVIIFAGVESQGRAGHNTGLYFTLNGTVYLPGATILITDIGSNTTGNRSDPQSSLVCVTTNVNIHCCRGADNPKSDGTKGQSRGEWYLPNGDSLRYTPDTNFYRARYIQQVRLYRKNGTMSPTGVFTCWVPNDVDSTMPFTANITIEPLLNVMLNGSSGTLTAGQNHTLTCEASGGGSMEYIYTWLKDGSEVSGSTSSTYSFSPLLAVHSGKYSCRVIVGTMNVTSRSVVITVVGKATHLYFIFNGIRYEPGGSILITDVGVHHGDNGTGDSVVCNTTDVNTQCCTDVGGVGEWFFPNGSMVLRNIDDPNQNTPIIRTGRPKQVRLNFRTMGQTSPTGEYTCVVPETNSSVIQTAGIRLVTELPVTTNPSKSTTTMKATIVTIQSTTTPTTPTTPTTTPTTAPPPTTTPPTTAPPTTPPTTTPPTTTLPTTTPPTTTPPTTTQPPTTLTKTTLTAIPTTKTVRTTTTMTAPTTQMSPLTVMVISNGSVLSAGQNHTLACEASGGESMEYAYTWLKDGSVVSGQTSSTYPFSPLLAVDSGQYSCRVRVGFLTVTSGYVTITVGPPSTGLYFTLSSTVYLPGDSILITDIGSEGTDDRSDPGSSLVCVTTNVNTKCCRGADNPNVGGRGEWYLPNGTRLTYTPDTNFYRSRSTQQVRLNHRNDAMSPTGVFSCVVPNDADSTMNHTATITIAPSTNSTTVATITTVMMTTSSTTTAATITTVMTTTLPPLTVRIVSSGGTLRAGQNHTLTCKVSRGGSMAHTYMWLKDGSEVSGQTLSTYSFTSLEVANSGQYSCQVRVGSMTVTSEGVDITVLGSLYFTWRDNRYEPGDSILITDIRLHDGDAGPANSLVCVTTDVNTQCCTDRGGVGEWFFPDGSMVPRNIDDPNYNTQIIRTGRDNQVRLNFRTRQISPTGVYTCVVPETGGLVNQTAGIRLVTVLPQLNVTLTESGALTEGQNYMLTCEASGGGSMAYAYMWLKDGSVVPGQNSSTYLFTPLLVDDSGQYSCLVSVGSMNVTSEDVDITVVDGTGIPLTVHSTEPSSTSLTVDPSGEGDGGGGNIAAVVVSVIVLFLVVAIIIAILIFTWYKRWWRQDKYSQQDIPLKEMGLEQVENSDEIKEGEPDERSTVFIDQEWLKSVPVDTFPERVQQMHEDREKKFEFEYNAIEKSPQASYNTAVILENRVRNRFGNIFPYDFNRVILESKPGELNSDYINASYIDGYQRRKMYIAAQGPTENSLEDFWRMIWEQHVPTIVMLTKVYEERKKCEQYWPENVDIPFVPVPGSPLSIQYNFVLPSPEFTIREMTVTNSDEPGTAPLTVTLYHYLGWPDHGVPANAISMVNFVKRVRMSHPYSRQDLLLVHCSAGVGRTGTFITLDAMLERINVEKSINIFEFVTNLRKQRVLMVQTLVQYVFIHDALEELLTCGETEIAAGDIRIVIGKLTAPVGPQYTIGFSKQFEILEKVSTKGKNAECSDAITDPNIPKNRYEKILPYNYTRVHLRPSAAHGSDYINASFIEGYRQKGVYIATQGPLPHTVNDFWRMIWEQEVRCIVMLCKTEENREEVCHQYWPLRNGCCETFGKYIVTLSSEEEEEDYIIRKINILEKQSKTSISQSGFTVTQIQYEKWPEDNVPETTMTILEIANFVQKVQMVSGNKPIVVMCNNGIGRSGAFICMHSQMERMKAEAMVNFFQFIKAVRIQRAGLVTSEEQYEFCHHVLADFLDGFDTYANFKEII